MMLCSGAAAQQDAQPAVSQLVSLIQQIESLKLPIEDEYELFYLQSDCAIEAALIASISGEANAISQITTFIEKLMARADQLDEPWYRNELRSYRAMLEAQNGDLKTAEADARAIPMRCYQAQGVGMIASQRARAGDMQGFKRLSEESLNLLKQALLEDTKLPPDERDWPSWMAWQLTDQWASDLFYSGRISGNAALALAKHYAESFSRMEFEPGGKAEVLGFLSSVIAGFGDHDGAKTWLAKARVFLEKEQQRVDEAEEKEDDWSYGVDGARLELIRTYIVLGDLPAAEKELPKLDSPGMRAGAEAIIGAHLKVLHNNERADHHLANAATFIKATDRVLDSLLKGIAPQDFDKDQFLEDFGDYDMTNFYWDAYYVALDLQRAGDGDRLNSMIKDLEMPMFKIGAQLGRMRGQFQSDLVPKALDAMKPAD